MVYLLTEQILKAEASRELSKSEAAADVTAAVNSLTPLVKMFIWKSSVLLNVGPLLTQNQISDLIISQNSIIEAKLILFL